jgi:hypothetical protein
VLFALAQVPMNLPWTFAGPDLALLSNGRVMRSRSDLRDHPAPARSRRARHARLLSPQLTYIAIAPFTGAEEAIALVEELKALAPDGTRR